MRKREEQQKNQEGYQLRLFDKQTNAPCHDTEGGTIRSQDKGVEDLSQLERQRTLTTNILEEVVEYVNLNKAYKQVSANKGSAGIDKMDIAELRQWMGKNINNLRKEILEQSYQVSPVSKVEIPKPGGGKRMLGIPTVKDRLVQQAIHQKLSQHYDPMFSENSYGFRPGRSAQQAVQQASNFIKSGKEWVVDIDMEKFFDKINHDRLMQRLSKGIGDKRLLRLIHAYLRAGMMEGGLVEQRTAGTPQGGPLSPLLSNIVLDELDKELEKRGHSFCRYADDCNIFVKSRKAGERILASLIKFIEGKLKLKVNREKSGVRHCSEVKFLGYTCLPNGGIRVSDKTINRLKDKVREITRRNRGVRFDQLIKELNLVIRGWTNYFMLANSWLSEFTAIDGWIRRKLRCYRLKQCGRRYTIVKLLTGMGIPKHKSWNVVMYSQGWWEMSKKVVVATAMDNLWFAKQGLLSLKVRMSV
ncbi:MAG: group II intron reverse transcriptase/maturase [Bacteroidales bacterium]|nr:group II intron reverse transcriptase/maturase [Bacteroidales bacterium]